MSFINPLRERITSKLPARLLYFLSYLPAAILWLTLKLIYQPLGQTALKRFLFYSDYLNYISKFPFREIHNIVHDHLTAPVAYYISRREFDEWFRAAQTERVEINWHNRNSWRGFGFISAKAKAEAGNAK